MTYFLSYSISELPPCSIYSKTKFICLDLINVILNVANFIIYQRKFTKTQNTTKNLGSILPRYFKLSNG